MDNKLGILAAAEKFNQNVVFTYIAESDGQPRTRIGKITNLTRTHVTIEDKLRGNARTSIIENIKDKIGVFDTIE